MIFAEHVYFGELGEGYAEPARAEGVNFLVRPRSLLAELIAGEIEYFQPVLLMPVV